MLADALHVIVTNENHGCLGWTHEPPGGAMGLICSRDAPPARFKKWTQRDLEHWKNWPNEIWVFKKGPNKGLNEEKGAAFRPILISDLNLMGQSHWEKVFTESKYLWKLGLGLGQIFGFGRRGALADDRRRKIGKKINSERILYIPFKTPAIATILEKERRRSRK